MEEFGAFTATDRDGYTSRRGRRPRLTLLAAADGDRTLAWRGASSTKLVHFDQPSQSVTGAAPLSACLVGYGGRTAGILGADIVSLTSVSIHWHSSVRWRNLGDPA